MSFFNQFLVPDQQEDDLLDPLAAEYARRSSSRGVTSIQPCSPVAATSATSSTATNPVPGPTVLAPQLSPGWPANNPQISPAQLGQSAPGQPQGPISRTSAVPVQQPQPQSIQRKPPVRSAVPRSAARPVQSNVPPLHPNTSTTQSATPATNTSVVPHSTWRYIAEHPELPEYAPIYQQALNQLSPEEKLEIRNKRIAAYPENQPEELEPIIDPEMGVQMGMRDVGPKAQAAMAQYSPVPQSAMPALETAKKYAVDPFERMSAASGRMGKDMLVGGAAAMVEGTSVPQPGDAVDPESGLPLPNPEDYQPEKVEKFRREYPRTAGALGAIGETGGSIVGDPRMWPFFFAGPEAAGGRFLSRATSSTLSRAASTGFAAQMGVGAAQQAAQIREIWGRPDIPLDQKYEALTGLVLNSIMAAHGTSSVVRGKAVPKPQPLDARLAAEINALGEEAKQQIFSRLEQKLKQQEALKKQTAPTPVPRTQIQKPAAPVQKISAPSAQIASVLSHPEIPREQKHQLIADSILGELTPETSGQNAAPVKTPSSHISDDPADAMRRYMEANGELLPAPKEAVPRPQLALDPEKIAEIGPQLSSLAHADQQGVLVKLHDKLSQAIAAQKKILGPDGQLHIVSNPADAGKLAQQFINDSISKHDERVTTPEQPESQPAFSSPSLANRASARVQESELPPARTRPIADMRNVPEMGHNMTADAPSVRRAKAEAAPIRGQTPTIKVKQEPAEVQAALTQPPAPVRAADAARVGQRDPQSGRTILQPSNDLVQNERLANQAAPELNTRLSRVAAKVNGAKFDRLRPQKGLQRLQEKVADGKPANTIGDNLAAQIVAPNVPAKNRIIAELHREFPVISVDDKFLEPREKAGYPSANVQVRMRNGSTAEVQIVAPEIQKKTDLTHRLYTLGRNYPENSPERAYYWNQAATIHMQALEKFKARTAQEQFVNQLPLGQRVVLKDGKTAKVVGFADKTSRIVVRTSKGLRTVKAQRCPIENRTCAQEKPVSSRFRSWRLEKVYRQS